MSFHVQYRVFIFVFMLNIVSSLSSACDKLDGYRSTETLKELFIGKCQLYKNDFGDKLLCNRSIDCTSLWDKFKVAIEYQPKCNFSWNNYDELVQSTLHYIPPDKFLFWEHVYSLVMKYSNRGYRFYTIAETMTGYLFDNLEWCGNATELDGFEKYPKTCPGYHLNPACPQTAQSVFWAAASKQYARQAYGDIHIMMNASESPAFPPSSYFRNYELPNINSSKVKKATILMVHYLSDPVLDTCSSESIQELQSALRNKGIVPYCEDSPRDIMLLLCSDNPTHPKCESLFTSMAVSPHSLSNTLFYILLVVIFIAY